MKRKVSLLCVFVLLSLAAIGQSSKATSLFNGKNLDGWKIHGTEKWFAEKGELICESGPDKQYGYLSTDQDFKDFELSVDFFQESNGNSGVFFHSSLEGVKITGWQAEVAPPDHHTGGIYESYGRGWLIQPDAEKEKVLKPDGWNTMKVRVKGDEVTTWLNGIQMIYLKDEKIGERTGKIALQIHEGGGVRVRWRNLNIQNL